MTERSWPFAPLPFLRDVAHLLALANQRQLQLNAQGQLQIGSVARLADGVVLKPARPHPLSEAQAPILSFVVGLAGQAGLIGAAGDVLCLGEQAHAWLGQPAHRQLEQLRQVWWLAPACGLRWLPAARRRRSLDGHWRALIQEVARWVAALPTDAWTDLSAATVHPAVQDVLCGAREGHRLPTVQDALQRQGRAVVRLLLQVALPCLGLIEFRRNGEGRLRPTEEGAAWLREALVRAELLAHPPGGLAVELSIPAPRLRLDPIAGPAVTAEAVEPGGVDLALHLGAPALCTFEVGHFAELIDPGPPGRYRLTWDSLQQGVAWGYSAADVLFLLARFSGRELPAALVKQVSDWQAELSVIGCEPGYKLHTAGPGVLASLNRREAFRRRTEPLATGRDAWLGHTQAYELLRYLRRTGYTVQQAGAGSTATLPLALAPDLPLSQLLTVLRTYRHLRRLVPGMAALNLEALETALEKALHADDRAAVERLSASHLTFLRHHLKRSPAPDEEGTGSLQAREQDEREGAIAAEEPELEEAGAADARPGLRERIRMAIEDGASLELIYADTEGKTTRRRVQPLHLETRWGREYLLAFCELRQDERHFRLDRIVAVDGDGA